MCALCGVCVCVYSSVCECVCVCVCVCVIKAESSDWPTTPLTQESDSDVIGHYSHTDRKECVCVCVSV